MLLTFINKAAIPEHKILFTFDKTIYLRQSSYMNTKNKDYLVSQDTIIDMNYLDYFRITILGDNSNCICNFCSQTVTKEVILENIDKKYSNEDKEIKLLIDFIKCDKCKSEHCLKFTEKVYKKAFNID